MRKNNSFVQILAVLTSQNYIIYIYITNCRQYCFGLLGLIIYIYMKTKKQRK